MKVVDARGMTCPKPVILTKQAIDSGETEIEVLVDNDVSFQNVKRFLGSRGYRVVEEGKREDGIFVIRGKLEVSPEGHRESPKETLSSGTPLATEKGKTVGILLLSNTLGRASDGLGEVLMKSFLGVLVEQDEPPVVLALMNEGVLLALPDSSACDILKDLEKRGTAILVCGTCTNHFGITDKVAVGTISNMFQITEAMMEVDKALIYG
ncbi:MAG TPA: sulfurtransferase-like selenium metabolism protein YedF [Acetomicrobium flavidum]|uniref:Selenium metabolism protein YedF n=2 Tax=Acetomicrobium TaxID=49894 RepID=I4BWI0_ACEMN|nr:selenium metabolism protein YedF [Acetomicrobium mobile DSM 13181]NLG94605.1 sulfurtransferase-like selenium metabolism protein YedF [Acetomicrobium flavidum]HOJ82609.1 sulfurtransferase-like selenium metabolism protein YedF [Acetomicrobium flavidum]HOM31392.1 sulfurtransferase-like selenium metabolism protein YedF [Acetomicrobium flavidum]HOP88081.1 sulfurtransferase-like selenium metabolism protein YedF [Acetomicrobium flavidum]